MGTKAAAEILDPMAYSTLELADVLRGAADPADTVQYS
jgi:hypothetical protein